MIRLFRSRLYWKFFFSYFLLILISLMVLSLVIRVSLPGAFEGRSSAMATLFSEFGVERGHMMGSQHGRMMEGSRLYTGLFRIFNQIIFQSMLEAGLVALLVAAVISLIMSRQFVKPLQQMSDAADRIAEGDFNVQLPHDPTHGDVIQDELSHLANRFNRMGKQLEETEQMRQQLITDVAHELRTPLTVIKGSMEGLADGVLGADQKTFESIHRQTVRLESLLNDLQQLSGIEKGALTFSIQPVNVYEMVEDIVKSIQPAFKNKGITLEHRCIDSSLIVQADPARLNQVFVNLLSNAQAFTPTGGRVWIEAEQINQHIRLTVGDTGIGIPEEHLLYIFSRFYRVDPSRSREVGGSGIGLTITKKIIEAHGGEIWAESDGIGKGSQFHFTLPAKT